jgi:hypothetical protein
MRKHKRQEKGTFEPVDYLVMHFKRKCKRNLLEDREIKTDQKARPITTTVQACNRGSVAVLIT